MNSIISFLTFLVLTGSAFFAQAYNANGHCEAINPYDPTAVSICDTQTRSYEGCATQNYTCRWNTQGTCRPRDPNDRNAVAACQSFANNKTACTQQSQLCFWFQ